ncbi:MAG: alpha/beta fold hydrolase [Gemmatimonadaceae bacterium]
MTTTILLIAGAVVAGAAFRALYAGALIRESARKRRLGPDGVVIGGETFVLSRPGAPALLLIHGAGDTPQTVRYLGEALHANGFHIEAPLLPGHGRSIQDFAHFDADDLTNAVVAAYESLRSRHEWTAVIGLSMGGALAVQLAATHHELPALGLVAPYLGMHEEIARATATARVWGLLFPFVKSGEGVSVRDPEERKKNLAYGVFTPAALRALRDTMRRAVAALPQVVAPTLVIQSRDDNRISVADAERAFALLGARDKRFEWTTGAAHVITVDYGRDHVFALLIAFMRARAPAGA